jgi:hypothetical protein
MTRDIGLHDEVKFSDTLDFSSSFVFFFFTCPLHGFNTAFGRDCRE